MWRRPPSAHKPTAGLHLGSRPIGDPYLGSNRCNCWPPWSIFYFWDAWLVSLRARLLQHATCALSRCWFCWHCYWSAQRFRDLLGIGIPRPCVELRSTAHQTTRTSLKASWPNFQATDHPPARGSQQGRLGQGDFSPAEGSSNLVSGSMQRASTSRKSSRSVEGPTK